MNKEELKLAVRRIIGLRDKDKSDQIDEAIDLYIEKGYTNQYWIARKIKEIFGLI